MADESIESPSDEVSLNDISAEARRAARRNKILQNREQRLQKILGPNSGAAARRIVDSSPSAEADEPVLPEEFLTLDFLQKAQAQKRTSSNSPNASAQFRSTASASPWTNYRSFLVLLGVLLPFICDHYFLLYFLVFESSVFIYHGRIPVPPMPPNIIFTLIMLMGLKEQDVARLKLGLQFANWIFKDLCLFLMFSFIPQVTLSSIGLLWSYFKVLKFNL